MKVKDIMVQQVNTCHPSSSLHDIAVMMWNGDCGSIAVVDDENKVIGMITDRDIAMGAALQRKALWDISAAEIIQQHPLYTCQADDDVRTALEIMREHGVRRLPVTDEDQQIVGILSMGDIVWNTDALQGTGFAQNEVMKALKSVFVHH